AAMVGAGGAAHHFARPYHARRERPLLRLRRSGERGRAVHAAGTRIGAAQGARRVHDHRPRDRRHRRPARAARRAAVRHRHAPGGRLVKANVAAARAAPGVKHVVPLIGDGDADTGLADGVAIVATHWWLANQARAKLDVQWDLSRAQGHSTAAYRARAGEALE